MCSVIELFELLYISTVEGRATCTEGEHRADPRPIPALHADRSKSLRGPGSAAEFQTSLLSLNCLAGGRMVRMESIGR